MKHIRYTLLIAVLGCLLGACGDDDFEKTPTGLLYKVVCKGKGRAPQQDEILLLEIHYKTEQGKTILSTAEEGAPAVLQYDPSEYPKDGSLREAISMLQQGASMLFKIEAKTLFEQSFDQAALQYELKEDTPILVHLELKDIMTEDQFKQWQAEQLAELQKKQQAQAQQQLQVDLQTIAQYLQANNLTAQKTESGLHYIIDAPGQGATPQPGNQVKVNYTGYLLNGQVFDTSLEATAKAHNVHNPMRPYEPLAFQVGTHQVIQGWDEGILLLNKGAKARLLIPSTLAYGNRAMGKDIPANSVLLFEVELVDFAQ